MSDPVVQAGFDYATALLKIRNEMTYQQIAEYCGYESPNAIYKIISGSIPSHPAGEAIYILYVELFNSKPS